MATDLGTSIRRARERKRWTQRQLADALGVNIKTVDNWENGRTSPRSSIGALEDVLGIDVTGASSPDDLVAEDDWEAAILSDPDLTAGEKREMIRRSRRIRAEMYPAAGREPQPAQREDSPHRAAG